jgi:hypothetical protein
MNFKIRGVGGGVNGDDASVFPKQSHLSLKAVGFAGCDDRPISVGFGL